MRPASNNSNCKWTRSIWPIGRARRLRSAHFRPPGAGRGATGGAITLGRINPLVKWEAKAETERPTIRPRTSGLKASTAVRPLPARPPWPAAGATRAPGPSLKVTCQLSLLSISGRRLPSAESTPDNNRLEWSAEFCADACPLASPADRRPRGPIGPHLGPFGHLHIAPLLRPPARPINRACARIRLPLRPWGR